MNTSYLSTQVTTIIGQLHGLFDEIGVPSQERESRETEVCITSQDLMVQALNYRIAIYCSVGDPKQSASACYKVNRVELLTLLMADVSQ